MEKKVYLRVKKKSRKINTALTDSLLLKDGRFAIASNSMIEIFNLSNFQCELIIKVNLYTERLIQFSNGKLAGKWNDLQIFTIKQHSYSQFIDSFDEVLIYNMTEINDNTFVCCGAKPLLVFRDINYPHNILKKINIKIGKHYGVIHYIKSKNTLFLSSRLNNFSIFWNLDINKCVLKTKLFECYSDANIFETSNHKLIIPDINRLFYIVNIDNFTIDHSIDWVDHKMGGKFHSIIEIDTNLLLIGQMISGGIFLYDLKSKKIKTIDELDLDYYFQLMKLNENIIIAFERNENRIWCLEYQIK